ncbi:MAG: translocation/assembly module TamB domain-containing protein [Halioglobus sp.]
MPAFARIALLLSTAILLLVVAVIGGLAFIAGTETGTRWAVSLAEPLTQDIVQWEKLNGTLLGPLTLRGVHITQPGMDITVQTLSLSWHPAALLARQLQVDGLNADGVIIVLTPTESTEPDAPFDPDALQLPVNISLQAVQLSNLQVIQGELPPQQINSITLDANLDNNRLSLKHLAVRLPKGGVSVTGTSALANPMPLQFETSWDWILPSPSEDAVASIAGLPVAGEFALSGNIDWAEEIGFTLDYRLLASGLQQLAPELPTQLDAMGQLQGKYLSNELSLQQLRLALGDASMELTGQVSLPEDGDPVLDIALQWSDLRWPLASELPDVNSPHGTLNFAGTPSAYAVELALSIAGKDIATSDWQGRGTGDSVSLQLETLQGNLLGGQLQLSGPVEWDPLPRWTLRVQGSDLNPGELEADYPGQLSMALNSSGRLDPQLGLQLQLELEQLTGVLLGYPLNLTGEVKLDGEVISVDRLLLDSDGNQFSASGDLSEETLAVTWKLSAPSPGALLPGAQGTLNASGNITGSPEAPRVQAKLQGQGLQLDGLSVSSLTANVQAGLQADEKLRIDITTGVVRDGEQNLLESLQLQARGTTSSHQLSLALNTGTEQIQTTLKGGVDTEFGQWQGTLAALNAVTESFGTWQQLKPAALSLSASVATLGETCLQNEGNAAQVCAMADRTESGSNHLQATLSALPLEMLVEGITGEIAGQIKAELAADGAILADATFGLSPGEVRVETQQGTRQLAHGGGKFAMDIGEKGLTGEMNFIAPEQGRVTVDLKLPALSSFPLAVIQPLRGRIQASLPDLSGLAAWIPEIDYTAGHMDADLQLAGTLDHPELKGNITLAEGAANIPLAGLQLREIALQATSNSSHPGTMDLQGGMASGRGQVKLAGKLDMTDSSFDLALTGDRLQVYNTNDITAELSPDIQLDWRDDLLTVRGRLTIPRADITPKLELSPASFAEDPEATQAPGQAISPSRDVVVINTPEGEVRESLELETPFRIDSKIQLILGDKVKINSMGFISRIEGDVTFTNTPDQSELIPTADGKLSLKDGTFRAFGQDLDIEKGQLLFANVPATEPELNVRAVRWIDNDPQVTAAGVLITGSAAEPSVELFSRRQLEPSEIQSYLLTGRSARDRDSVLSIGTYLSPRFFVGYGYNLLEKTSEFNSLFSISPRYGVGANLGEADNNMNVTFTHEN